jgi:hypothetical protein
VSCRASLRLQAVLDPVSDRLQESNKRSAQYTNIVYRNPHTPMHGTIHPFNVVIYRLFVLSLRPQRLATP